MINLLSRQKIKNGEEHHGAKRSYQFYKQRI